MAPLFPRVKLSRANLRSPATARQDYLLPSFVTLARFHNRLQSACDEMEELDRIAIDTGYRSERRPMRARFLSNRDSSFLRIDPIYITIERIYATK